MMHLHLSAVTSETEETVLDFELKGTKQNIFFLHTALCKTLEPPLIALNFAGKIRSRCSDLLKHAVAKSKISQLHSVR